LSPKRRAQIANPASFLAQKILIHEEREPRERAKDLLYIHDTIEVFRRVWRNCGRSSGRRSLRSSIREGGAAAEKLFGKVDDAIREASQVASGRKLTAERLAETSEAGLKEIFTQS